MNQSPSSRELGDIVEDIVALLYEGGEAHVRTRQRLPSRDGSGATSEIDVLISRPMAGKLMHVAVECKNYRSRVSKDQMGASIARLNDVGIPTQHGVFVCVNSYDAGALRFARNAGIQTLLLDGLEPVRDLVGLGDGYTTPQTLPDRRQ